MEGPFPTQIGDAFLLCSDGLTGRVQDEEIGAALTLLPVDKANKLLINLANLRGGHDNITVVSAKVDESTLETASSGAAPLVVGGPAGIKPPMHPGWWIALGVSGLASVALGVANGWTWGIIPAVAFALLLIVILIQRSDLFNSDGVRLGGGRRLGKGPHRAFQVKPPDVFCRDFIDLLNARHELSLIHI